MLRGLWDSREAVGVRRGASSRLRWQWWLSEAACVREEHDVPFIDKGMEEGAKRLHCKGKGGARPRWNHAGDRSAVQRGGARPMEHRHTIRDVVGSPLRFWLGAGVGNKRA